MRFSKFNRNKALDPLQKYRLAQDKASYLANRGKLRVLDSLYTENQTWGALHKAWKGYVIGQNLCETEKTKHYARVIQKLQNELGLQVTLFPDLSIFPLEGEACSQDDITTCYDVDYVSKQDMREW